MESIVGIVPAAERRQHSGVMLGLEQVLSIKPNLDARFATAASPLWEQ